MNNSRLAGSYAAFFMAVIYIVGFLVFFVFLTPEAPLDRTEQIAFYADNHTMVFSTILFIYVICGFVLAILVLALYDQLKFTSPSLMQLTSVFGFIWCGIIISAGMIFIIGMDTVIELYEENPDLAATTWIAVSIVFQGLGGGTEIVGGVWLVLVSYTALVTGNFSKGVNALGVLVGVAGIVTIVPALEHFTAVFGLGQILWFVCLGVLLLKGSQQCSKDEISTT